MRALYLYSPIGRESWMVGRDACKPSGWLEIHTSAPLVEGIDGVWREHVPGGSWSSNPGIKLQLHALQDAFEGFGVPTPDGAPHAPHALSLPLAPKPSPQPSQPSTSGLSRRAVPPRTTFSYP